ncbi:MAG TPA: MBOAT family O-acyltransferase [Gemmataceae bacterium]|nr:MBOAT family O-acyltransferase [Gemmataceae bacterium]
MSFEDRPFLILFSVTYVLWWIVRRRERMAVALLLSASLIFYGHKHWELLPILLAYCVVDWAAALLIERGHRPRLWMAVGVTFNLAVLAFYKYTPLVVGTVWPYLPSEMRVSPPPDYSGWAIPFGISFYAFTGVAYIVDVYRKTTVAEPNLARYTLAAAFFPHLVAGPILRPHEFLDYVRPGRLAAEPQAVPEAAWLIARGFFKKLVVANRLGGAIDPFFAHVNDPTTAGAWALPYVYLYALQIYFDFSAYTDLARGIGLMFGYRWPDNFDLPYLATNIADFWRRWHMTLSRFLRDYLYIPLGGNRKGPIRTNINLMITMLLGGLWHGASWSFFVWGGLHGVFLIIHKMWAATPVARWLSGRTGVGRVMWLAVAWALTFHAVCLAWCFFRLTAFADSVECVRKCVEFDAGKMWSGTYTDPSVLMALGSYAAVLLIASATRSRGEPTPYRLGLDWGLRAATLLLAVLLAPPDTGQPFIYFQF